MQCCWKKYASERPHFSQVVDIISNFLDHLNSKRDSYCSDDDDEDVEEVLQRRPSRPSRTSSVRSGIKDMHHVHIYWDYYYFDFLGYFVFSLQLMNAILTIFFNLCYIN